MSSQSNRNDASFTAPGEHTTAAAMGKEYLHEFPPSDNPDKSPARTDDGPLTSAQHARRALERRKAKPNPQEGRVSDLPPQRVGDSLPSEGGQVSDLPATGGTPVAPGAPDALRIEYHHPLEKWLGQKPFRWLLGRLSVPGKDGQTALERIITSYRNPGAPAWQRVKYWPLHLFIDRMRGDVDAGTFRRKLADHRPTVRGLVIVARSIAEFGLTIPQKFSAPLFAVWNFTNRCNLACKHCYQDSEKRALADELTLDEKLALVDQMGRAHMPMLAISGGEPTISPDLLPVIVRAKSHGMHLTIATNGTTMTPKLAADLAAAGLRYVEISLDSVDPARHDAFRGAKGLWEKTVAGARAVVATPGLRLGIAMCVHQGNVGEVEKMIEFARGLGAGCFAHFNFIPVGRGLRMVSGDITPRQRERLLAILNREMNKGGFGVISTAPQLGRVCLAGAGVDLEGALNGLDDGKMSCSHAGSGSGAKARVVAKYLGGCGAGRTYICIEPDGNITPCVYLPHRVMGNIRRMGLMEIFRKSVFWEILNDRKHRLHHCEVCVFRNYCGGCRARADAYYGQLHAGDPGCIFNEKHWDALVAAGIAVPGDASTPPEDLPLSTTRHGPG